jgi:alkanesulfonate monooxygenase SsuD/methylene tetrahydromethanopterin reductase-like flavin-dependent oxidoreductase (luciferase family)
MRYGISLPNFDLCGNPRTAAQLAHIAEEAGWDGFFLWDHVLWTWPHPMSAADPFMTLAAMAMTTARIKLGTMVTPVPRRRPWTLARQVTTLDHLSGGRAIMGVGLGGNWFGDYSRFGEPTDQKAHGEMLDEGLQVITGLWSGEPFSFEGKHFHIKDVEFLPKPVQQPRIPVWVAGMWPNKKPFRRAAQWDGVFPILAGDDLEREITPGEVREMLAYMKQYRESDAPFDVIVGGSTTGTDHDKNRDHLAPLVDAGLTWWIESFDLPTTFDHVRARLELGPPRI